MASAAPGILYSARKALSQSSNAASSARASPVTGKSSSAIIVSLLGRLPFQGDDTLTRRASEGRTYKPAAQARDSAQAVPGMDGKTRRLHCRRSESILLLAHL